MKESSIFNMAREGRTFPRKFGIVDAHAHLGRFKFGIPDLSLEGMMRTLARVGVTEVWCSHMYCMSDDCSLGNDELLRAAKSFPGRFLAMASFWPESAKAVGKEAERCFRTGVFIGIKLHNINEFPYDHLNFHPAYSAANERAMPVLFHAWGDEKVFQQISRIAEKFPRLSILLAHAGCANTAGYVRMARQHENIYLDLALSRSPLGLLEEMAAGCGAGKLVFGSDIYFLDLPQQLGKVAGADLSEEDKLSILGGNARRIRERIRL